MKKIIVTPNGIQELELTAEEVAQRLQHIGPLLREPKNDAKRQVNTPNFKEMEKMWWTNRRAMYAKYYDMFKSYTYGNYARRMYNTRVI